MKEHNILMRAKNTEIYVSHLCTHLIIIIYQLGLRWQVLFFLAYLNVLLHRVQNQVFLQLYIVN